MELVKFAIIVPAAEEKIYGHEVLKKFISFSF